MKITRINSPILPRNKKDPTQSSRVISRIFKDIDARYSNIKTKLFDKLSTYQVRVSNADSSQFIYSMSNPELARLLEFINSTLQDDLLDGGLQSLWMFDHLDDEFQRGTQFAFTNLSTQYQPYADQTNMHQLLSSTGYLNQVSAARVSAWNEWKGVSDTARTKLSSVITEAVIAGTNTRDTAAAVKKRLDVSKSDAMNIAQTEQLGAYRTAARSETRWAKERIGMDTAMMHISALLPTSRQTHVERHGHTYTPDEVEEWYAKDGNRFRCHCSQVPVVLDSDGKVYNQGMMARLALQREQWKSLSKKVKS